MKGRKMKRIVGLSLLCLALITQRQAYGRTITCGLQELNQIMQTRYDQNVANQNVAKETTKIRPATNKTYASETNKDCVIIVGLFLGAICTYKKLFSNKLVRIN